MAKTFSNTPKELIEQGVINKDGFLSPAAYNLVTNLMPIVCVDIIPVHLNKLGAIVRATGSEAGKLAIIGGRVKKDELLIDAITRHLKSTIGHVRFSFFEGNDVDRPFYIAQYSHQAKAKNRQYDPTKHSIALIYLINLASSSPMLFGEEASSFQWISPSSIPSTSAFNQHLVLKKAANFIKTHDSA